MKTGIYTDLSIEDYHKDRTVVSSTGLKKAKKSTRDFCHYVAFGQENKSCFDFGNAFEIALMDAVNGSNYFDKEVAVMRSSDWEKQALDENPDLKKPTASKLYRDLKASFEQENFGKYIISENGNESKEMIDMMVETVMRDNVTRKLLTNTQYQISCVWEDSRTGLKLKTRPDVCRSKREIIVDIKTCKDASPSQFSKDAANLDYPLQACMQMDGVVNSGLMDKVDQYFWLAVEKSDVPNHALYRFNEDDISWCMDEYEFYLDRAAKGIKSFMDNDGDIYATLGYGENADNEHGILTLDIPLWYRS